MLLVAALPVHAYVFTGTRSIDFNQTSAQFGQGAFHAQASWSYETTTGLGELVVVIDPSTGVAPPWPTFLFGAYLDSGAPLQGGIAQNYGNPNGATWNGTFQIQYPPIDGLLFRVGWYASGTPTQEIKIPLAGSIQTVSLTNPVVPDIVGHSITGTATGAQGGNAYNISVISGSISASINSSTGAYQIIANGVGPASYKVWISAGNGYNRSNDASGSGTVGNGYKVKLTIPANPGQYTIIYTISQNGAVIGTTTQLPGAGARIVSFTVPTPDPVVVTSRTVGVIWQDNHYIYTGDPNDSVDTGITDSVMPSSSDDPTPAPVTTPPTANANNPTDPANTGTVWTQNSGSQTDLLTNSVFRQGVEKLMAPSLAIAKLLSDKSKIDAQDKTQAAADVAGLKDQANHVADVAQDRATQGKSKAQDVVDQFGQAADASMDYAPAVSTGYTDLDIGSGRVVRIPDNPFSNSGPFSGVLGTTATFVRGLIAWGIVVAFFIWVLSRLRQMTAAPFQTTPFGTSIPDSLNSIKVVGTGGGLGYAVKLVTYAVIFAIVLTMPLGVMAAVTAKLPFAQLVGLFVAGPHAPTSGMLHDAMGIADQVIPWAVLLAAPVWYFVVEAVLFPSQIFWMMFIKFLPS